MQNLFIAKLKCNNQHLNCPQLSFFTDTPVKCPLSNNLFYKFKLVLLWYESRIEMFYSHLFLSSANLRSSSIFVSRQRECMRTAQIGPDLRLIKCVQGRLHRRLKQTGRARFDQRAFIVKRITFFYLFLFVLFVCFFYFINFSNFL